MADPSSPGHTGDLLEVVSACHRMLGNLDTSTRSKAIRMLLLAFDEEPATQPGRSLVPPALRPETDPEGALERVNRRTQYWLRKYEIQQAALERVLDFENDFTLIAHLPGDSKREQAINCYLLAGLQAMLRGGDPKFRDEEAVALCKREGCYDRPNHSTTRTQLGKRVTGDKESSFTLTTLGLEQAASLVKRMTSE